MKIIVKDNTKKEIIVNDTSSLSFTVGNNASLTIKYALFKKIDQIAINGNLNKNATLKAVFADFSSGEGQITARINLNKEGANATWDLASLASKKDKKQFDISFIHHQGKTKADMQNYGVALDESFLTFSGVNHIKKTAKKSNTNQSAKIIVFDKSAHGKANPILKIDENDVLASHAAIVGSLNENHLFYLKSRGLSEDKAKALIVYGYLQPIAQYFDKANQDKINQIIWEKCHV